MKKLLLTATFISASSLAFAQYVAQTIQDRINQDQIAITLDQNDIAAKQADIDSIVADTQAQEVTSKVSSVQEMQSSISKSVVSQ